MNLIPNCSEFVERISLSKKEYAKLTELLKIYCGVSTICESKFDDLTWESFKMWLDSPIGAVVFIAEEDAPILKQYLKSVRK